MSDFFGRKHYTKEDNKRLCADIFLYNDIIEEEKLKSLTGECDYDIIARALLDSSLIFPCKQQFYSYKIIQCGNYYQVYNYHSKKVRDVSDAVRFNKINENRMYSILNYRVGESSSKKQVPFQNDSFWNWSKFKNKMILDKFGHDPPKWLNEEVEKKEKNEEKKKKEILSKNIHRSKNEMVRLIKSNEEIFKTFLTLTFAEVKYTDIELANKKFDIWRTNIKALKKDFAYVCVPEFQKKRGRKTGYYVVHYHLLTNLEINDNLGIIIPQKQFTEKQLQDMSLEQRKTCYDIKYWSYGFASVFNVTDINVVGYMSKYMTKDIDNRLWGKRRYLSSRNLKKSSVVYLDESEKMDWLRLTCIETSMNKIYENLYCNKITGEIITFTEYKKEVEF